jgi:copper homeostasis protein
VLLEVIAETVEDAREAEQGGAGRIELVRDLSRGGFTPARDIVDAVVKAVRIPVRVMVRETEAFDRTGPAELGRLREAARHAIDAGAAGVVLGFLRDGAPDMGAMAEVLDSLAASVTFHRAFDEAADQVAALALLGADLRVDRLLTSGGAGDWDTRLARLLQLRQAAPRHLTILPGYELDDEAVRRLAAVGFPEAHIGRAARIPPDDSGRVRAAAVAHLIAQTVPGGRSSNPA